jgi:hypothetical protein
MRRFVWGLVLAAAGLPGVASCQRAAPHAPVGPVAELPDRIDLGPRGLGEVATATFTVANRGGAELVIGQFQSNCSCSGIEREQGGEFIPVEVLRLRPGERAELRMRVSVRGVPVGSKATNGVSFRTNDPNRPAGRINAVIAQVTGGVLPHPDTVVVGTVQAGTVVRYVVDVRDDAVSPRALDRVTSSQPERVTVRLLEVTKPDPEVGLVRSGVSIAQLEVSVNTDTPGEINAAVALHVAGPERAPNEVRVVGRVTARIEVSPPTLVLPRSSREGPVYSATCVVKSGDGKPISVTVDSCPPHLTVTGPAAGQDPSPIAALTVVLDPKALGTATRDGDRPVRLRCRAGDHESVVELRVLVTP